MLPNKTFYTIYSIKAKEILSRYQIDKVGGNYDMKFKIKLRDLLHDNTLDEPDSQLFRQIKLVCGLERDESGFIDLTQKIMILNFEGVFNSRSENDESDSEEVDSTAIDDRGDLTKKEIFTANDQTRSKYLFKNGFDLVLDDGTEHHFRPFDKSGSMSRRSRITFIADSVYRLIEPRLCLDIDFKNIQLILSKYYAYRGLYLSSGAAIEFDEDLIFNEETVIVIKDSHERLPALSYCTAEEVKEKAGSHVSGKVGYTKLTKNEEKDVNAYDGEGIILPEYGRSIAEKYAAAKPNLNLDPSELHSFQIRLPFTKGMLHAVDFNGFLKEHILTESNGADSEEILIEDVFGIKRKLSKVKVILTESMFKCVGWLKELNLPDPMQYYFDRIRKYDHVLYVNNTNLSLSNNGKTQTTYQLLNTLDLDADVFRKVVDRHFTQIDALSVKDLIAEGQDAYCADDFDYEGSASSVPNFIKAAGKNADFEKDPKVIEHLKSIKLKAGRGTVSGKLQIAGENRFLSGDLIGFMVHVASCSDAAKIPAVAAVIEDFRQHRLLFDNAFYAPKQTVHYCPREWYGHYRSPHLSRNEECLLRYYTDKLYQKYLGHLTNIIFVGRNSLAPATMGGADFDGDIICTIADPLINQAIARGVYEEHVTEKLTTYKRRIPVIDIPSPKSNPVHPKATVDFDVIRNTFSSLIGRISNIAIRIGKIQYDSVIAAEDKAAILGDCDCSFCTILGGLELDAAKAGRHPDLTPVFDAEKRIKEAGLKRDVYLKFNREFKALQSDKNIRHGTFKVEQTDSQDGRPAALTVVSGKNHLITTSVIHDEDDAANLDRLPCLYMQHHQKSAKIKVSPKVPAPNCFKQYSKYPLNLIDEEKLNDLRNLILIHRNLLKCSRELNKKITEAKNTNLRYKIDYILNLQYGSLDAHLSSGDSVKKIIDHFLRFLKDRLTNAGCCKTLINELNEQLWAYTPEGDRAALLKDLLCTAGIMLERDYPEDMLRDLMTVLTDFRNKGYKIFYYIIKDILIELNEDPQLHLDQLSFDPQIQGNVIFENMKQAFYSWVRRGDVSEKREQALKWETKRMIGEIFNGDFEQALMYGHYLRSKKGALDKSGAFFWNIFDERLILRSLIAKDGEKHAE